jgi:flagellar biosynthetic protein FliR
VIALATALVASLGMKPIAVPSSVFGLLSAALSEVMVGGLLAFGVFAAFAAFMVGGRAIDMQIGFGVANLIDPISRTQAPLLGTAMNLMGIAVFLAIDGHHLLLRGFAVSLDRVAPGSGLFEVSVPALAAQFGVAFSLGLAMAAPVLVLLLLIDLGLSVMSRTMPQWNVFFVSMPLKIFAGLTILALSVPHMGTVMNALFRSIFSFWDRVLP